MCDACGCAVIPNERDRIADRQTAVEIVGRGLLDANDRAAAHNRVHFDAHGVLVLNLMSSPGAGKTALLEATIDALSSELRIAVIEGDLETDNDARRIRAHGVPAVQITTGNACHLDADMIHRALHDLPMEEIDLLFIENVGNLVCPACFDLGQHRNVVLLSTTEGDDKPAKYPVMFRAADLVVLTKTDLLPFMDDFDPARAERALRSLAHAAPMFALSARRASGLDPWLHWLRQELELLRSGKSVSHSEMRHEHRPAVA
jgi:hydrogenase nickel incorporation protein HypB